MLNVYAFIYQLSNVYLFVLCFFPALLVVFLRVLIEILHMAFRLG